MSDICLPQSEADALLKMEKYDVDRSKTWKYPDLGGKVTIPLASQDRREQFLLDIYRGRINLRKGTYQNRGRAMLVLARLDFGGAPHRNPDGAEVGSPHLHVYREGYGDKWAIPVPSDQFPNVADAWTTLQDFMRFCNVVERSDIQRGLFT